MSMLPEGSVAAATPSDAGMQPSQRVDISVKLGAAGDSSLTSSLADLHGELTVPAMSRCPEGSVDPAQQSDTVMLRSQHVDDSEKLGAAGDWSLTSSLTDQHGEQTEPSPDSSNSNLVKSTSFDWACLTYGAADSTEITFKFRIKDKSQLLQSRPGEMPKFKLPLVTTNLNEVNKSRTCTLDSREKMLFSADVLSRTVLMLGVTGAGKSTLIDGMANFVLGVEWQDDFRFTIIDHVGNERKRTKNQAISQTEWITTYVIPPLPESKINYELRIVDMPGFCDTNGIAKDKELMARLQTLLSLAADQGGIVELDMASFVLQASQNRLTAAQRYILHSMQSMFDKTIRENISVLITFADGKRPTVLKTLKESGTPYSEYFMFNNSALFVLNNQTEDTEEDSDDESFEFARMFWIMGQKSMQKMFDKLGIKKTKSLQLSREVLASRQEIGVQIQHLRQEVTIGLGQLSVLAQENEVLKNNADAIARNQNFTYNVSIEQYKRTPLPRGFHVTNCLVCNVTCHYPCVYADNINKIDCCAMHNGYCTVCKKQCPWNYHKNDGHKFDIHMLTETRTYDDMRRRYQEASGQKVDKETVINGLRTDFIATQTRVGQFMEKTRHLTNRLSEIAMTNNPYTVTEYLQMMIDAELQDKHPNYGKRVQMLREALQDACCVADISSGEFNPWGKYLENPSLLGDTAATGKGALGKLWSTVKKQF